MIHDRPSLNQNKFPGAAYTIVNGRSAAVGNVPFLEMNTDMETQIHHIEQEAYASVLRAFKAQSDAITWEKESLITELRKELRVSDEEHRELLSRVNADGIIRRIREWRKSSGIQEGILSTSSQPDHDPVLSPAVSASRKKQKTSNSVGPSSSWHISNQPSSSVFKRSHFSGVRGKKPQGYRAASFAGRLQGPNHSSSGALAVNESVGAGNFDPLIGRKVWTRWPEDNNFYEAVVMDYNPVQGQHALVYDINTSNETWEWINLKEIPPHDIRWEGDDPDMFLNINHGGVGRGFKKSMARGGAFAGMGRGQGILKAQSKKDFPQSQNGIEKKLIPDIEILHTATLIMEVEKVVGAFHPDPTDIEIAKRVLKEHEQALLDVIGRLEDASDGESGSN